MSDDGHNCDWLGEPGSPPTPEELCEAHFGRINQVPISRAVARGGPPGGAGPQPLAQNIKGADLEVVFYIFY